MGYTRIVQFGNITEVYEYEKPLSNNRRKRTLSAVEKKRAKKRRKKAIRTKRSIHRARSRFFQLVHHNNVNATTISFCTLTFASDISYEMALRAQSDFFQRLKKRIGKNVPISHISVPEKTKIGRYHFHLLIYDLPPEIISTERNTRNFQRLFRAGYLDIGLATTLTEGIAGYMAKYMAKSLGTSKSTTWRGYNTSRNIKRPSEGGSNSLSGYLDLVVDNSHFTEQKTYETIYLGRCDYKRYTQP